MAQEFVIIVADKAQIDVIYVMGLAIFLKDVLFVVGQDKLTVKFVLPVMVAGLLMRGVSNVMEQAILNAIYVMAVANVRIAVVQERYLISLLNSF